MVTQIQSKSIYLNNKPVTKATMSIVSTSDVDNFILYLSNDGGSTFESVSNNTSHTFTDQTGQEVQYKITTDTSGLIITKITVKINS